MKLIGKVSYEFLFHDGSMVLLYMVTWIPSIYPLYVRIYTSTMDPMGMRCLLCQPMGRSSLTGLTALMTLSLIQEEPSLKWPRRLPECAKPKFIPSPSIPNVTRNGWKLNTSILGVYHCVDHVLPHLYFETFGGFTKVRDLKPSQTIASNKLT